MNKKERINKKNASTKFQRSTPTRALLSIGSQQLSSFTKLSFDGQAKLTGVATPTRDTDVVPLQYLQARYLSKNDPNPGYLPIHGGNMTGNINMGTHSVFNLKQPEKPKIELPSETDKPKDPREEDGFAEKTAEEQEQEIKEYNTKLAEYQKKIDDYNAAWEAFYSEAATVKYVKGIVDKILNNDKLSTALNSATEVEKKIALAQKALGIEITINPDADTNPDTDQETPDPAPVADTEEKESPPLSYNDLPSVIKNSQFVVTQSQNKITGDLKMTNAQIANIKTPDTGDSNYAANVTYLESKLKQPQRAFLSNTLPTESSSSISLNGHIPWLSTTNGSSSPAEPDFKSKLADQCFDTSSQENLKVKTAGLLVLSVRGTWSPTTSPITNGSTPTPTTISVNLTVTPDNSSRTNTSSSGSDSSGDASATTLTIPLTLYSGESVQLQLPITTTSSVKIATTTSQTSNGGSDTSSQITLSSWSWEAALYPTDVTVTNKTTPPTTETPSSPSPSSPNSESTEGQTP
ncbi:hypothetical protein FTN73_01755 [Chlamydia trachomatis]|uniref:Uncharacterized protein n=2 Tax=Chlamydia trachomatis TaxID=813 RepID=O84054_CHLTR|nr:hypothetical protein [Chlamydia trachomatis]NP_219554.1 hypothetical protein CT_051 [Chlamydia trachomatis D/UW-3/CX]AAC67642.1 hypothetical protein CT_051 [Chlamydia trachomatis D/UW-3/CX]ADI50727.1 Hypothetical protein CTDEC_0051 [Chlamydia trachomatis D-EC]ADI51739.1 Hypothetical protein CTDLC_0051 [Chlamydia trachomatis D-LC]AFU23654.1 hypothetical protein CT051 [Chlamydia trachomatis]AFU23656.1 hypothetical protein CT051 [Chlamydia trachomatis]